MYIYIYIYICIMHMCIQYTYIQAEPSHEILGAARLAPRPRGEALLRSKTKGP